MLKKLLSRLEDPDHPLLGPTLWGLQRCGLWQPNPGFSRLIYNLIYFTYILFVLSQYVELWFVRDDIESTLRNLSVSMLGSVCAIKVGTFIFWQQYWREVVNFVSALEKRQLEKKDKTTQAIVRKYIDYSRSVTNLYWSLSIATVFIKILTPLGAYISSADRDLMRNGTLSYPEMMSSWVPFDRTRGVGYWVVILEHSFACFYGGGIIANYDLNAVVLMSFFCGQFEILIENCKRSFGEGHQLLEHSEAMKRIKDCHLHHLSLINYSRILNSLISPGMFFYVVICSLMICASASLLTNESTTTMQRFLVAEYLLALIAQLFLYCWHGNEVFIMSQQADRGVYESEWWRHGVRLRRCALLLAGQLRKTIVFTAGPFTTLTVATFIAILKGAYSYLTLINNSKS